MDMMDQLKQLIESAVKPGHSVEVPDFQNGQLIVKLPIGI